MGFVPAAQLKVYESIGAFDGDERDYWEAYAASGERRPPAPVMLSRESGISGAIATAVAEREHADVLVRDGVTYVCPHRTRLRLLAAVVAFRRTIPRRVAPAFLPEGEFDRAIEELERLRAEHPGWRNHILESAWEVPLRWFVLFDEDERVEHAGGVPRYETTIGEARSRAGAALSVLRDSMSGSGVVGLVAELRRWVGQFGRDARLVLDYGSVAGLFSPSDLAADETCHDIWEAIRSLAEDDQERAAAYYAVASERWAGTRARERLN